MKRDFTFVRTGSLPRTIYYHPSKLGHSYSYFKPQVLELKGKSIRKIEPYSSEEFSPFRKMNLHILPDSRRTLIPELCPEDPFNKRRQNTFNDNYRETYMQFGKYNQTDNYNNKKNTKRMIKDFPSNNNNFLKNSAINRNKNNNNINQNYLNTYNNSNYYNYYNLNNDKNNNNKPINLKHYKSFDLKTKYDHYSEIKYLPGSHIRYANEIKDDISNPRTKNINTAYTLKFNQLYNSQINCLKDGGDNYSSKRSNTENNVQKTPNYNNNYFNKISYQNFNNNNNINNYRYKNHSQFNF